jgi:hypothetical protein
MKYLDLPLAVKRLKRSYFQYIKDKAAAHLAPLHGRYFNIAGRKALSNRLFPHKPSTLSQPLRSPWSPYKLL